MNPLPDYTQALRLALDGVESLGRREHVLLDEALGRVLAADVVADRDYPPFDRSTMDGYAVRAREIGDRESFPVAGVIAAGQSDACSAAEGTVIRIATGAPVPSCFDAVIPHEKSDRSDPVRFTVSTIAVGANIHARGSDAGAGTVVVKQGTRFGAQDLGILATVGCTQPLVITRPRVVILTSGDEVRDPAEQQLQAHQIRNAGHAMLGGAISAMGGEVIDRQHIVDDPAATRGAVQRAIDAADVVVTVGGISAGERDFFADAFESCGVEFRLRGAAIKPGKPITIGSIVGERAVQIVALPGNPVSVLATAHLFLWPILRRLSGLGSDLAWRSVRLDEPMESGGRRQVFRPCQLSTDQVSVKTPDWAGSGDLIHTAGLDGLVELPISSTNSPSAQTRRFLPWAWRC